MLMINREGIRALFMRRPVWLVACALPFLVLIILVFSSQRYWQQRASALEGENLNLQLKELTREVTRESDQLIERARDLAQSDLMAQLLQENAGASSDGSAILGLTRRKVDALVVISASQVVRFSAVIADDRLIERPPEPAMIHFFQSAPAVLRSPEDMQLLAHPSLGFVNDRWVVVQPIMSRASPTLTLGWLVVARTLSPTLVAHLAGSLSGTLTAHPLRAFDASTLPPDILKPAAARSADKFDVTTHLSSDNSSGYAALRDSSGRSVWLFRLDAAAPAGTAESAPTGSGNLGFIFAALAVLLCGAAVGLAAFKRYTRRQNSVDARYKAIIDQANDAIVIVDAQTQAVLYTNPAFLTRLGYTATEAQELTLRDIFADGAATTESVLARLGDANSQFALNMQQRCKNGSFIDIEVRCNALDVDGRGVLAYVTHDVSLRRKAEQQLIENQNRLDRMAHHDQLTGLPNRHYLTAFLPQAIAEATADGTMLGVVFLDLDRFKHINDTRGHETGDKLLQEVASRLRAVVRDSDVVIRMGGDEFVVVFRNVKSCDEVTLGAGRIIETLNRPIIIDQHPLQTTGSVGVSLFPRDGSSMVELLKHSDTAMYQAKDRGRNNVQMFSQIMNKKLKHRVAVEASLREALRLKQLDVHYQPFVNLQTRKVVGLEALMRWRHPVHGMVPADQFIPVAEETGLIVPMGNFVLHRTLQNMTAWRKAGVPLVPMSLNIAPAQLQRGELQSTIATLLKTHGLRPDMLQLEMTERAMFDSHAPAGENRQDTMARLRDLGVKIAIDDFGTGYSSLSYLKHWRVDALKIDRSFVRDLVTDSSDLAIVSAIIAIARHLQIQVIAEGIEAYQQAEILQRLGCTVGQGFLFARPMPAEQCLELLGDSAESAKSEDEDMLAVFSAGGG
jgi:diguanylate cyclase (GGDEF)-like protein/PAS domain S-box-containing protein